MIDTKLEEMINDQIVKEIYSAHLYLNMASWFDERSLGGYAHWFYNQYLEELDHAMIFFGYLARVGGKPVIGAIDAPETDWESIEAVLAKSLSHEEYVTSLIYALVDKATELKDFKTVEFLKWFVNEQVEEEDNASSNLGRYQAIGTDGAGLQALDAEMAARVYTQTTQLTEYKF